MMKQSAKFIFTERSSNKKTGPIPTVMSSPETCPQSCPFNNNNGCYASNGPINIWWKRVNKIGITSKELCAKIREIGANKLWRLSTAGDLVNTNEKANKNFVRSLISANRGKKGFTYTHLPVENHKHAKHNQETVKEANENGFAINLSANNPKQALRYKKLGVGPVVSVVKSDQSEDFKIDGVKFIICPAVKTGITCAECGLCARTKRRSVIAFPCHGTAKKKTEKAMAIA